MTYQKKTVYVGMNLIPIIFYMGSIYAMHMMHEKQKMAIYGSLIDLQSRLNENIKELEETKHRIDICTEKLYTCNMEISGQVYLDSLFDENFKLNMRIEELISECNDL